MIVRKANVGMFKDPWKKLMVHVYLFYNELHQCKPYKNLSLVITYNKFTKKSDHFQKGGLHKALFWTPT